MKQENEVMIGTETVPVSIQRRKGRTISIRVEEDGSVSVRAPFSTKQADILSFIKQKQAWIEKQRNVQKQRNRKVLDGSDGQYAVWLGRTYRVQTVISVQPKIIFHEDTMIYHVKEDSPQERTSLFYHEGSKVIARWIVEERKHLDDDICVNHHLPLPRITVRYMTSRWGSCSAGRSRISISCRLIHFPKECFDYVLLHEYAHLLVQNHSADFYREIEKRMRTMHSIRKKPTPTETVRMRAAESISGTLAARTCRSGSATVMATPSAKLTNRMSGSLRDLVSLEPI